MNVILGKDVVIEFYKEGDYRGFLCADNVEYNLAMETISVRTLGSGHYKEYRGQSISYSITLTGLIPVDLSAGVTAFDLIEYTKQMVDIEYRMIFRSENGNEVTQLRGKGLVVESSVTGPADFAGASFTIQGNGEPLFGPPPSCNIQIFDKLLTHHAGFIYKMAILGEYNGPAIRYDWSLDGGAVNTALSTGWFFNLLDSPRPQLGPHTIDIWPVCDNGVQGQKLTINFNVPLV